MSVVSTAFLIPFYNGWTEGAETIDTTNLKMQNGWGPAIDWINANTNTSDSIIARKTYDWAWYTGRNIINIGSSSVDFNTLYDLIRHYQVHYIVVDRLFYNDYTQLRSLYSNTNVTHLGMEVAYQTTTSPDRVIVYNTTKILQNSIINSIQNISSCDSLSKWTVWFDSQNDLFRGNLTIEKGDFKEGNGSIRAQSAYLPSDDINIVKFQYNPSIMDNFVDASNIMFFFKINSIAVMDKMIVQFVDSQGTYVTLQISYNETGKWQLVQMPVNDLPQNFKDVKSIIFWLSSEKQFSVWIDQISLQVATLQPLT